jgi:hypothetical protein
MKSEEFLCWLIRSKISSSQKKAASKNASKCTSKKAQNHSNNHNRYFLEKYVITKTNLNNLNKCFKDKHINLLNKEKVIIHYLLRKRYKFSSANHQTMKIYLIPLQKQKGHHMKINRQLVLTSPLSHRVQSHHRPCI